MNSERTLTAVRTTGPITRTPIWRVHVTDGNASGLAFDRNLRAAVMRAGRVIGLTEAELEAPAANNAKPQDVRRPAVPRIKDIGCKPDPSHGGVKATGCQHDWQETPPEGCECTKCGAKIPF